MLQHSFEKGDNKPRSLGTEMIGTKARQESPGDVIQATPVVRPGLALTIRMTVQDNIISPVCGSYAILTLPQKCGMYVQCAYLAWFCLFRLGWSPIASLFGCFAPVLFGVFVGTIGARLMCPALSPPVLERQRAVIVSSEIYEAQGLIDKMIDDPKMKRTCVPGLDGVEDMIVAAAGVRCSDVEQLLKLFWRFSQAKTIVDYALLLSDVRHLLSPDVSSATYLAQSFESVREHVALFYEAQGDDETILPLKWMLLRKMAYTVVLTPFVEEATATHFPILNGYLHRAIPVVRDRQAFLQELVNVFLAYSKALAEYVRTGDARVFHEKPDPVSKFLIDSAELLAQAPGIALVDGVASRAPAEYLEKLRKCEAQSHRVMALGTDYDRNALRQMQVRIAEAIARVESDVVLNMPRVAPYIVGLSGAPGIGKTGILVPEIIRSLISCMGAVLQPNEIYNLTDNSPFHEGYSPATRVVLLDDMVLTNPAKGQMPPQMEFLHRLEGNAPLHLNMATLESKGKVIALPDLVTVTTNVPHYHAAVCVNNPYVIERRINTWEVEMLEKFLEHGKYSPAKDPKLNGRPDFPRMLMYRFRRYTPRPTGGPLVGDWMYFPTFMSELQRDFLEHRARSVDVAKTLGAGVQMCPKCNIAMSSHFWGQCMNRTVHLPKSYAEFFPVDPADRIPQPFTFESEDSMLPAIGDHVPPPSEVYEPQGKEWMLGVAVGLFWPTVRDAYKDFSVDRAFMKFAPFMSDRWIGKFVRFRFAWHHMQPPPSLDVVEWVRVRCAVKRSRLLSALVCGTLLAVLAVAVSAWMAKVDATRYVAQGNVPSPPTKREELPSPIPVGPQENFIPANLITSEIMANLANFRIHGEYGDSYVSRETKGLCLGGTIWVFPLHQFLGFNVKQIECLPGMHLLRRNVGHDFTRCPFRMHESLVYHDRDLIFVSIAIVPRPSLVRHLSHTSLVSGETRPGVFHTMESPPLVGIYDCRDSPYDGVAGLVWRGQSDSVKGQCGSPLVLHATSMFSSDPFPAILAGILVAGTVVPAGERSPFGIFSPISKTDWEACVRFFFSRPLRAVKPLDEHTMRYVAQSEGAGWDDKLPERSLYRKIPMDMMLPGESRGHIVGVAGSTYKTSMFRTPFHDVVYRHFPDAPTFLPATAGMLPNSDYPRSFFNAYVEDVHTMRTSGSHKLVEEVEEVRIGLEWELRSWWSSLRPYTISEATRGIPGRLKAFPRDTSCGLLLTRGDKKRFFEPAPTPDDPHNFVPTRVALDQLELLEKYMRGEYFTPMTVTLAPKMNEVRDVAKVEASGARTININSMYFNLLLRRYALPVMEVLSRDWEKTGCVIGINPASPSWGRMHAKLNRWGGKYVSDLDGKCFDKSQDAPLLCGYVFLFVVEVAELCGGYTLGDKEILENLLASLMFPFLVWHGDLYCINGTNTSGNSLTTFINSLMMIICMRLSFRVLKPRPDLRFEDYVELLVYGDDLDFAVHPEMKDCMHPAKVAEFLLSEGFIMKSGAGKGSLLDWRDISEVTFLKRRFVPADWKYQQDGVDVTPILCPLETKSMIKMMAWRGKSDKSIQSHCLDIVLAAHAESFMHGRTFFDAWTLMSYECLAEADIPYVLRTYEEYADAYCKGELVMWNE